MPFILKFTKFALEGVMQNELWTKLPDRPSNKDPQAREKDL